MSRYEIEYRDADPGFPVSTWRCRAHSRADAIDRFMEADDGFEPLRIARVLPDVPRHRWRWTTA